MNPLLGKIKTLKDLDLTGKCIFMRVDFNVPIKDGNVVDNYRIEKTLPSIRYILEKGGKLILASHLGRPNGSKDKNLSLKPVAEYLNERYDLEVLFIEEPDSDATQVLLPSLQKNQVILLENLRFHKGEKSLDPQFADCLSSKIDIYINEGFGISHRAHTSVTLVPESILQKGIGIQFENEIKNLDRIRFRSEEPLFFILGGSKVQDKFFVLESLLDRVSEFFIGGLISYTFLKVQGVEVGESYVSDDHKNVVRDFMDRLKFYKKKLWLPKDHVVIKSLDNPNSFEITPDENIPEGYIGVDIGPKTQELYSKEIFRSKSLFWNGPMGFFEKKNFKKGTDSIAKAIANHKEAYRVVGGGHSALAVREFEKEIDHVSTGGGASLYYLQGSIFPGIKSISLG